MCVGALVARAIPFGPTQSIAQPVLLLFIKAQQIACPLRLRPYAARLLLQACRCVHEELALRPDPLFKHGPCECAFRSQPAQGAQPGRDAISPVGAPWSTICEGLVDDLEHRRHSEGAEYIEARDQVLCERPQRNRMRHCFDDREIGLQSRRGQSRQRPGKSADAARGLLAHDG